MPLHLIKLCVGCDSVKDLEDWIQKKWKRSRKRGPAREHFHVTRMVPKRVDDILAGGSLYWVIRGEVSCRQRLIEVVPFVDAEGVGRCRLVMEPKVVPVEPRPYRAFQGWRYLEHADAPRDLGRSGRGMTAIPEELRRELRELGLL